MVFGCGVEMAGITVSRGIVKWFKGREMALAMGSEMALARLGLATSMIFSPMFASMGGDIQVSRSVAFGVLLLLIALKRKTIPSACATSARFSAAQASGLWHCFACCITRLSSPSRNMR